MDGRPHKVIRLVPAPQRSSQDPPPEYLRPYPEEENKPGPDKPADAIKPNEQKPAEVKPNEQKPANTVVIITTPPDLQNAPNDKNVPIDGLQHHFIGRGSLIDIDVPAESGGGAEDSFGEKYVDVVDTEVVNREESGHTQSYISLAVQLKRIYNIFTIYMLVDATFSALAMYAYDHTDKSYAHKALYDIFTDKDSKYSHIVLFMFVLATFPLVGIAIVAYPKPKWKVIKFGRWAYFILFEVYLVICIITYIRNTNGFYDTMRKNMLRDLDLAPDEHLKNSNTNAVFNTLRDFSQGYYGCCGVDGYKDWTDKRRDNLIDQKGYPIGCCDTNDPKRCFAPLFKSVIENGTKILLILTEGCLQFEMRWTYGLSITYMMAICCIIVITAVIPVYLYKIVALANKYDIDLVDLPMK